MRDICVCGAARVGRLTELSAAGLKCVVLLGRPLLSALNIRGSTVGTRSRPKEGSKRLFKTSNKRNYVKSGAK
jgi:hypothetical protein